MKIFYRIISVLLTIVVVTAAAPTKTDASLSPLESAFSLITKGVSAFESSLFTSPIRITNEKSFPILQYADMQANGLGFFRGSSIAVGGLYGEGRYVAFAHENHFTGASDGKRGANTLRKNILSWLGNGFAKKRIGFTSGHQEWLTENQFSDVLKRWCKSKGITLEKASLQDLSVYDMVVVGSPWTPLADETVAALTAYAEQGGGLLVLGLGWSWGQYQNDAACVNLPVNALGAKLGFWFESPVHYSEYVVSKTISSYTIIDADQQTDKALVKLLAADDNTVYALEGQNVMLHLTNELWRRVRYPKRTIDALDALYEKEYAFIGETSHPYEQKLWFVVNADSPYFMYMDYDHCGMNAAGAAYFVDNLKGNNNWKSIIPDWGYGHEVGHAMVNKACGSLFQPLGTNESWNNVINVYAYKESGLFDYAQKQASRFASDYSGDDGKYAHLSGDYDNLPDAYRKLDVLQANPWIFLKLPMLITEHYGWESMQLFFTTAAEDTKNGKVLITDDEKTAYMIVNLSIAYNMDLSPIFAYWGFSVDEAVKAQLSSLPKEKILTKRYKL